MNQLSLIGQKITGAIDNLNDHLTSYRLMLYFLLALIGWALIGSFFNQVPYSWHEILVSTVWLVAVCWAANKLISKLLDIPSNKESDLITGLILALILSPPVSLHNYAILAVSGVVAIASKYVITVYKSHIFNPAALGAFISGEFLHDYAAWWVGTKFMTPLVVIGGILILRKMKRFSLVLVFLAVFALYQIFGSGSGGDLHLLWSALIGTPVLFFAAVMLIEPLTSPSAVSKYIPYAILVGLLYSITKLKISPEESLLIGNILTFVISTNRRYEMKFIRRVQEAEGIYSYVFTLPPKLKFRAGQYMEWTLAHNRTDRRGNRRYFTVASSPTEPGVMFTVKVPPQKSSSFKQRLNELKPGEIILASHVSGNFTLPNNATQKLAFLAGGVGITPFRSMAKAMIDKDQKRDVVLLYSASSVDEYAFQDLFRSAAQHGLKTIYNTDPLDPGKIRTLLPDYKQRVFMVSGPYGYVQAMHGALLKLGVSPAKIVTDYFPGYGG